MIISRRNTNRAITVAAFADQITIFYNAGILNVENFDTKKRNVGMVYCSYKKGAVGYTSNP